MIKNTYFGFTDKMKPMQKAKVEKVLDELIRYDNDKIMRHKEWTLEFLNRGFIPAIEENYSYYSPRIDGYTKPKTLYKLEKESSFYEVPKTIHDFAVFVLENGFTDNEKATNYATEETERLNKQKEEEERIRLQKEAEEKAKREQQEEESKQRAALKQAQWKAVSDKHMTDEILNIAENAIEKSFSELGYEVEQSSKDEFKKHYMERFIIEFGNIDYIIHNAKYVFNEGMNGNMHNDIHREICRHVFNIAEGDHPNTINAKIKAFYNGTEYKGNRTA